MSWISARRYQISVVAVVVMLLALFEVMAFTGIQLLHDYDTRVASCAMYKNCDWYRQHFTSFRVLGHAFSAVVLAGPLLAGVFWGTMSSRDLEEGALRYVGNDRKMRRWIARRLSLISLITAVLMTLLSVAVTWWQSPLDRLNSDPFQSFDVRGAVPVAYAVLAVTLGALVGVVVHRRLVAVGATTAIFVALRGLVDWLRPHLSWATSVSGPYQARGLNGVKVVTQLRPPSPGDWVLSDRVVTPSMSVLTSNVGIGRHGAFGFIVRRGITSIPGVGPCLNRVPGATARRPWHPGPVSRLALDRCVERANLHEVLSYVPASRYWPLQSAESAIYLVLAIVLGACCIWWLQRRLQESNEGRSAQTTK
jgi:hypothetical protein